MKVSFLPKLVNFVFFVLLSIASWGQSSDIIVYPTLTFYSASAPTVADLTVRAQNIAGTISWYNQKVGGAMYAPGTLLDPNASYWAELPGASIGERLQTKIYFADTPVISAGSGIALNATDGMFYVCEGEDFTLIGDNLGGLDEFESVLTGVGFSRLNTGLQNGNAHFINSSVNTWTFYNELINGDPNTSASVGTPGVSMYMLNNPDVNINRTEKAAVWNAIVAAGLGGNFYWMGMSQFLNSNAYSGFANVAQAESGWFWEDGTYYDVSDPIDADGRDWRANEPNDFGTAAFTIEEDKLQIRNNEWVDQVGNSTVPSRQSGAIIEFNDASGIQWYRNDGTGWVAITGANTTQLTETSGVAGSSVNYRVDATFNGSLGQSAVFTVNVASYPPSFTILDNDDANNPNEVFFVCEVGDTQVLKTDIPAGTLNFTWNATPTGIVNLTPSSNTVTVEGVASGSVLIECIVENASGCTSSFSITFEVNEALPTPILNSPVAFCSGSEGSALPFEDNTLPTPNKLAWFDSVSMLEVGPTDLLIDGRVYNVYAVRRQNPSDDTSPILCRSSNAVNVTVNIAPNLTVNPIGDYFVCDLGTGMAQFDLTNATTTAEILGTADPLEHTIRYFFDASIPTTEITTPSAFTSSTRTIEVLVYNNTVENPDCEVYFNTLNLVVSPLPVLNGLTPDSVTMVCEINDTATITADGPTGTDYEISWVSSNGNVNIVPNPLNEWEVEVTALADNTTSDITYTITDISTIDPVKNPQGCASEYTFTFEINTPNTPTAEPQQYFCESGFVSDLVATVNTGNNEELVWLDASDVEIPETDWATTTLVSGTVYKAVARHRISRCESVSFNVTANIESSLVINPTGADLNIVNCNDGTITATFDFALNESNILGGESLSDYEIIYFVDAARRDRIGNTTSFVINNASDQQTIYVRVFNRNITTNSCFADTEFTITDALTPIITVTSPQPICDGETLDLSVDTTNGNYDYTWSTGETTEIISVATDGTYTVYATDPVTGCESVIETIEVINSGAPSISDNDITTTINSNGTSNINIDNSLNNLGTGNYEFALDDGNFIDLPTFNNVPSGIHTVRVRDKNGCGSEVSVEIYLFGFPRFFTPNNDGENEYWQVKGLDTRFYQHSTINVYNRYGKLLKTFSTANQGWDGTFNGAPLPSEDYWYTMILTDIDGNTSLLKGHFALVR